MLTEICSVIIQRHKRHVGISLCLPLCLIFPQSSHIFLPIPLFLLFLSLKKHLIFKKTPLNEIAVSLYPLLKKARAFQTKMIEAVDPASETSVRGMHRSGDSTDAPTSSSPLAP